MPPVFIDQLVHIVVGGMLAARADPMELRAGETLFRIADISTVWVEANVPEFELSSIRVGAEAAVRIRSLPGKVLRGKVELIHPEVEVQTRTARIRIELANPDGALFANMYADVEILTGSAEPVVTAPDSAVIDTGDRQVVILDRGEGSPVARGASIRSSCLRRYWTARSRTAIRAGSTRHRGCHDA